MRSVLYDIFAGDDLPATPLDIVGRSLSAWMLLPAFLCSWPLAGAFNLRMAEDMAQLATEGRGKDTCFDGSEMDMRRNT